MSTRIYKVVAFHKQADGREMRLEEFLIAAVSPGRAQQHVAKKFINAKIASPMDVAELMGKGAKVEAASNKDDTPPLISGNIIDPPPGTNGVEV